MYARKGGREQNRVPSPHSQISLEAKENYLLVLSYVSLFPKFFMNIIIMYAVQKC